MDTNICPICGSRMVVGEVALRHTTCPKCGYSKTQVAGKVEAPSPLEGLIEFVGILGLAALAAAGISLLLGSILRGVSKGDITNEPETKPYKETSKTTHYKYYKYKQRVY